MKKIINTQIKKVVTHDKISLKAKFPSGATISWSISRSQESLTLGLSNDPKIFNEQSAIVRKYINHLKSLELTYGEMIDLFEILLTPCKNSNDIIIAITKSLEP